MILAFVFSVLIYLLLFAITFLVEAVLHLEALSVGLVLENLKIYFLDGVGVFFAISPIIALVARMKRGIGWLWYLQKFIRLLDYLRACPSS